MSLFDVINLDEVTITETKKAPKKTTRKPREPKTKISDKDLKEIKESIEGIGQKIENLTTKIEKLIQNLEEEKQRNFPKETEKLLDQLSTISKKIQDLNTIDFVKKIERIENVLQKLQESFSKKDVGGLITTQENELVKNIKRVIIYLWTHGSDRFGKKVKPMQLAHELKIPPGRAKELVRYMWNRGYLLMRKSSQRYQLNLLNDYVCQVIREQTRDTSILSLLENIKNEIRELIAKGTLRVKDPRFAQ